MLCLAVGAGCSKEKAADQGTGAEPPAAKAAEPAAPGEPSAPAKAEAPTSPTADPTEAGADQPAVPETGADEPTPAEAKSEDVAEVDPAVRIQVEGKLAGADAIDGTMDKIVTRCAGCGLTMAGSAENPLKVAGYTMYFCSPGCKERFSKDTTNLILALEIPEK